MSSDLKDLLIFTLLGIGISIIGIVFEHLADKLRKKITKKEK
ncbi:hypothetical protein [Fusobacterium perfoetens]|nr:hypothetical protein [Fusobacterium perfoetens]